MGRKRINSSCRALKIQHTKHQTTPASIYFKKQTNKQTKNKKQKKKQHKMSAFIVHIISVDASITAMYTASGASFKKI
jgi:hypothetical protein